MVMQYDILGLDEAQTRNTIIETLTKEGKKNIQIISMIPINEGSYNGFSITVLFEEDIIQIDDVKTIKEKLVDIKEEILELGKQRNKLDDKLAKIKDNCAHDIIVRTYKNDGTKDSITSEGYCLICNQHFIDSDYYKMDFTEKFKYIIEFDCTDELKNDQKVEEALSIFYEEKEQNPDDEDKLVIKRVNDKIKIKYKRP